MSMCEPTKHNFSDDGRCFECGYAIEDAVDRQGLSAVSDADISMLVHGIGCSTPETRRAKALEWFKLAPRATIGPRMAVLMGQRRGKSLADQILREFAEAEHKKLRIHGNCLDWVIIDELVTDGEVTLKNIPAEQFWHGLQWDVQPGAEVKSGEVVRIPFEAIPRIDADVPWYERSHTPRGKPTVHDCLDRALPQAQEPTLSTAAWRDRDR